MNLSRFVVFFFVLLAVLVGGGILAADSIAKTAIEKGGASALGVDTSLDKASIGVFSGEFGLEGLEIANPGGFKNERFLSLGSGKLEVTLRTLMDERVVAPLLELEGIQLVLEAEGMRTNYGELLQNLEQVAPEGDQDADAKKAGKSFVIDRIVLRDIGVELALDVPLLDSDASISISEIVLDDLAEREFTLQELMAFLVQTLLEHASKNGVGILPEDILGDLQGQLDDVLKLDGNVEGLDDLKQLGNDLKDQGEAIKGLFDRD